MFHHTALKTQFVYVKLRIFTISPGLVVKFVRVTIDREMSFKSLPGSAHFEFPIIPAFSISWGIFFYPQLRS